MENQPDGQNTHEVAKLDQSQERQEKQSIPISSNIFQGSNKIKFIIFGIVLLIVVISGGALVLNKTLLAPSQNPKTSNYQNIPSIPTASAPSISTPSPTSSISGPELITGVYKNHYGEYQIKVPDNWGATGCMDEGSPGGCATLSPAGTKIDIYSMPVITVDAIIPENNGSGSKSLNLNIPALGSGSNASFEKTSDKTTITFMNRGVFYSFEGNYTQASKLGYSADKLDQLLKTTAASITFLNEPFTCKDPALIPLSDFPDNFALYNYHDSDSTDPVYSYWPYTNKRDDSQYIRDAASKNSKRGFMVHYIKDGGAFNDSSFANSVTGIHPNKTNGGFDDSGTGIWHLNCIATQEDGPGNDMPYHISENDIDLFGVHIYGNASNPQTLWGVQKWNINLLKSVRNKVYIKRGSLWQAYKATDYFATMPTAYGGKPAIYLYSPNKQEVQVEIHPRGQLTKTDKLYNSSISGWQVVADKNGIVNSSQKYLYYEAVLPVTAPEYGYVVPYSQLFDFSRDYVKELGLTNAEASEFVTFWKSKLPQAPFYFVSNLDQDTISQIYPLKISPTPQTLIRVELYFKPLSQRINVAQPRKPIYPNRVGFTAVEWGGIFDQN